MDAAYSFSQLIPAMVGVSVVVALFSIVVFAFIVRGR